MEEVVTLWHKLNFRQGDEWLGVGRYDCLNLEISPVEEKGNVHYGYVRRRFVQQEVNFLILTWVHDKFS
jgi:hypothetical protein